MRRRDFIRGIASSATAWPLMAHAQQLGPVRRVGVLVLNAENDSFGQKKRAALEQELGKLGWHVGQNLQLDYRWGVAGPEAAGRAVAELLALKPDVMLANSVSAARVAKEATRQVPIVFTAISEPISLGIVASLSHPGGNITGFTNFEPSVGAKWLELLKEVAPHLRKVAFLFNPDSTAATEYFYGAIESASTKLGVNATKIPVRTPDALESLIKDLGGQPDHGLIVQPDTFLAYHALQIVDLVARYRLPAIYPFDFYTTDGGLLSYGPDLVDQFRRAAEYINRILRGEKPSNLPVQEPNTFRLVVNKNAAKAAELAIPDKLLALADEVIE